MVFTVARMTSFFSLSLFWLAAIPRLKSVSLPSDSFSGVL